MAGAASLAEGDYTKDSALIGELVPSPCYPPLLMLLRVPLWPLLLDLRSVSPSGQGDRLFSAGARRSTDGKRPTCAIFGFVPLHNGRHRHWPWTTSHGDGEHKWIFLWLPTGKGAFPAGVAGNSH